MRYIQTPVIAVAWILSYTVIPNICLVYVNIQSSPSSPGQLRSALPAEETRNKSEGLSCENINTNVLNVTQLLIRLSPIRPTQCRLQSIYYQEFTTDIVEVDKGDGEEDGKEIHKDRQPIPITVITRRNVIVINNDVLSPEVAVDDEESQQEINYRKSFYEEFIQIQ